jgi:hypothetical protein
VIKIGKYLVSDDILSEQFACNLKACKGACCVGGDDGAILTEKDTGILEDIYPDIEEFITEEGKAAVAAQGHYTMNDKGGLRSPLIEGKACAYVTYTDGIAWCGIEKAWAAGKTWYRKPVSCHLYPIRTTDLGELEALNYERWEICSPACEHGKKNKTKVYEFLKEALIRKCGEEFYEALQATGKHLDEVAKSSKV